MLNLDTHILLKAFAGELSAKENQVLGKDPWGVSAIVLWELAKLYQHGRIQTDIYGHEFRHHLSKIHVWPIDFEICRMSTQLDFVSDPADELIAATSLVHRVPLATRDKKIRKSKIVPFAF